MAQPRANLGYVLGRLGQSAAAMRDSCAFMAMHSDNPKVLGWLAWVLATAPDDAVRNGREALMTARRGELAGGDDPALLDALAAAYAELGRYPEALQTARQAVDLAMRRGQPALAEAIRGRARLFQAGRPLRDPPPHFPDNRASK